MHAGLSFDQPRSREGYVLTNHARLYYRDTGDGLPIIVLHGGPDFDHNYLLPEMDRLADSFHLIYYDQRGRGRSAADVLPEDVSVGSEIEDLESVRRHFGLDSVAVLGHSWGGLLALEYAIRHPDRVSHLILMNTAPASGDGARRLRRDLLGRRPGGDVARMRAISSSARYGQGNIQTEAEYYRIHFRPALRRPQHLDSIVARLRTNFTEASVLKARAIEQRLYNETWRSRDYDLIPKLRALHLPTLVLHGENDLIPVDIAIHIAQAIPDARLSVLPACGHFAYLESPDHVHEHIASLLGP